MNNHVYWGIWFRNKDNAKLRIQNSKLSTPRSLSAPTYTLQSSRMLREKLSNTRDSKLQTRPSTCTTLSLTGTEDWTNPQSLNTLQTTQEMIFVREETLNVQEVLSI